MHRLIAVSNRLPISVSKQRGAIRFVQSAGGLATGLFSLSRSRPFIWIGWPGTTSEKINAEDKEHITTELSERDCKPVFLSKKQLKNHYQGFSNKTIWPLFHYFPLHTVYENRFWQYYMQVNQKFCDEVVSVARDGDHIWVHDYQLMLLPQMLRERLPESKIGFFLHIPFPSFELFRLLPWRTEILAGLLGADVIGFHTYDYVRHFLSSVCRIMGHEHSLGELAIGKRIVKVDAFPMGIDYEKYAQAGADPDVQDEIERIRRRVGNRKIIISIDRLDYTKGIIQRLEAFDLFLSENPRYRGEVTLILVAVPSRTHVEDYIQLRKQLEQLIGRVNGEYGSIDWTPVLYFYRSIPFKRLTALYNTADVALVTPLRDGMNLIAKEFIASKTDGRGVLILSEMAGAASELGEALVVNANDKAAIVQTIVEAIEMPVLEQIERNRLMQERLAVYDISRWADDFLNALSELNKTQKERLTRKLAEPVKAGLCDAYKSAKKRLLLLDYDGTLVGYKGRPEQARPDDEVMTLLAKLAVQPENELVIISGRDKDTLEKWLGDIDAVLIAEHGAWTRLKKQTWACAEHLSGDWKDVIRPILKIFADRTPGAAVEEKDFSMVWHCRRSDPELAAVRMQELRDALLDFTVNLDVGVFEGKKILEIRHFGTSKGRAAELWLKNQSWDFILTAGDDYTDEDIFAVMPQTAYSIKVGPGISKARFNVDSVEEMRLLLRELAGASYVEA